MAFPSARGSALAVVSTAGIVTGGRGVAFFVAGEGTSSGLAGLRGTGVGCPGPGLGRRFFWESSGALSANTSEAKASAGKNPKPEPPKSKSNPNDEIRRSGLPIDLHNGRDANPFE